MDNITHAFAGAAMADAWLPAGLPPETRRFFVVTGVVAASAPDIDLIYTRVTEPPLGFLLHHRGHSHTLPGLVVLALLMAAGLRAWPDARRALAGRTGRVVSLIGAGLVSHVLMDSANSYGTHLLFPFSSRWYFGDAVFVLEPWFWVILGTALALNVKRRGWRGAVWLVTLAPVTVLAFTGLIRPIVLFLLLAAGGTAAVWMRSWSARPRAIAALAATAAIFVLCAGLARVARSEVRQVVAADGATVIDVALDANPASPWCWSLVTLERPHDTSDGTLVARRGTLSLFPGVWPAASCATAQLLAARSAEATVTDRVVWHQRWVVDVDRLRTLAARDCRIRAWLQFARIPYVADGRVTDLRYENPFRSNFSEMTLDTPAGCPSNLTDWDPPRRDLLRR